MIEKNEFSIESREKMSRKLEKKRRNWTIKTKIFALTDHLDTTTTPTATVTPTVLKRVSMDNNNRFLSWCSCCTFGVCFEQKEARTHTHTQFRDIRSLAAVCVYDSQYSITSQINSFEYQRFINNHKRAQSIIEMRWGKRRTTQNWNWVVMSVAS